MAGFASGFEKFESRNEAPVEVVIAPTPEEIVEILDAGANIVICQDAETRIVEDNFMGGSYADHKNPIRRIYIAGAQPQIDKLLMDDFFAAGWRIDASTYAPYLCLQAQDLASFASLRAELAKVFGENTKFESGGDYVWAKRQDKEGKSNAAAA